MASCWESRDEGDAGWVVFDLRLIGEGDDYASNFKHTMYITPESTKIWDLQVVVAERYQQIRAHVEVFMSRGDGLSTLAYWKGVILCLTPPSWLKSTHSEGKPRMRN